MDILASDGKKSGVIFLEWAEFSRSGIALIP
jgi:hypothetical protein